MRNTFMLGVLAFTLGCVNGVLAADPATKDVVGQWKATMGEPEKEGAFYSIMALDLKKDQTVALSNTMPNLQEKGKQIVNKATGKWSIAGDVVTVTLDPKSPDGREIPEGQRKLPPLTLSADGKTLAAPGERGQKFKRE